MSCVYIALAYKCNGSVAHDIAYLNGLTNASHVCIQKSALHPLRMVLGKMTQGGVMRVAHVYIEGAYEGISYVAHWTVFMFGLIIAGHIYIAVASMWSMSPYL